MEDIMADHIPVSHPGPEQDPMYDRDGVQLKIGDNIIFSGGKGRIVDYLAAGTKVSGAVVRVVTTHGQRVDLALKLSGAEWDRHGDGASTGTKYGV
jgi:hypothetical protein